MKKLNVQPQIKKSDAYMRGYNAAQTDEGLNSNPYKKDHPNYNEYDQGFADHFNEDLDKAEEHLTNLTK